MTGAVTYAITPFAYRVQAWRNTPTGAQLIETFTGGNSTQDSAAFVPPGDLYAEDLDQMGRYALSTAQDMADKHGIDHYDIRHDDDEEEALLDQFDPSRRAA